MDFFLLSMLNGLSYGLLLFMLSAGLTLILSMMGVLNFAHASFYMLGAYLGYWLTRWVGFWPSLLLAPLLTGGLGVWFEHAILSKVRRVGGHLHELLVSFGLSYLIAEWVQLVWGRSSLAFLPPEWLRGPAFTLVHGTAQAKDGAAFFWGSVSEQICTAPGVLCSPFPATRVFIMLAALLSLALLWLLLTRTRIGLVIEAALSHPDMVQCLGHNLPGVFRLVFGIGTGLAGLAGVIGGSTFVTEPQMAHAVGPMIFVVVVLGGLGSLWGAFWASLCIGLLQTLAVSWDYSLLDAAHGMGEAISPYLLALMHQNSFFNVKLSQLAPILPYLLLVLVLIVRPQGLLGKRQS